MNDPQIACGVRSCRAVRQPGSCAPGWGKHHSGIRAVAV